LQLGLFLALEYGRPQLRDPEYGRKLTRLRQRLAERPHGRPLIVALGSSRTSMGLRPEYLQATRSASTAAPVVFNFGLCSSGPVLELRCLRHLLADGIHPDHLLVEVWPPFLAWDWAWYRTCDIHRLRRREVRELGRFHPFPRALRRQWNREQVLPWLSQRALLLNHWAPDWVAPRRRMYLDWQGLNNWGWVWVPHFYHHLNPKLGQNVPILEAAKKSHRRGLARLCVSAAANQALREMLALCRRERTAVTFVLLPEMSEWRTWYSPATRTEVVHYLRSLDTTGGATVLDARAWAADEDFVEGVHLTHDGARAFTKRLDRELLLPLLEGKGIAVHLGK
jgi:hypothetical protein